jgi:hypothetical protein
MLLSFVLRQPYHNHRFVNGISQIEKLGAFTFMLYDKALLKQKHKIRCQQPMDQGSPCPYGPSCVVFKASGDVIDVISTALPLTRGRFV